MENYQYVLPKVGVATNGMELKLSQQRLLQQNFSYFQRQNYDKNHSPKDSYTDRSHNYRISFRNQISESNPFRSQNQDRNLLLIRAQSLSRINKNLHQQIIKASLSNELANQITIKQQLKKYKKQEQLERQRQIMRYNRLLEEKQLSKQRSFKQDYKNQANHIAKMKELKKQQQKYSQYLQKHQIDRQYRNNHDAISKIMQGIQQPLNPKRFSQLQMTRNSQSSLQYNNNPQVRIIPIKSHHRPSFQQKSQLKMKMKETLLEQMRQNSEKKIQQRLQRSKTKYVDDKYKVMDNPIINPVDLKIAKDNPYLIKELLAKKMAMERTNAGSVMIMGSNQRKVDSKITNDSSMSSNRSSFLSRRGSNSLPRLVY